MRHGLELRLFEANVDKMLNMDAAVAADELILDVCCCPQCLNSSEDSKFDYANALDQLPGAGKDAAVYKSGLPSFSWDEAAEQISRWNVKWDDDDANGGVAGNALGTPGTITFGFLLNPSDPLARAMTSAEIARTLEGIAQFEEIANLSFTRILDSGSDYIADEADAQMDFQAEDGTNGGYATPNWSNGELLTSTVNIGVSGHADYGSWSYKTTIHEIGHAVGLPHPGDYNGAGAGTYETSAEYVEDTYMYTMMSYFSHSNTGGDTFESVTGPGGATAFIGGYATGPLLHDIAALHRLYGANMNTRTGDTVYGFNSTEASSSHWHLSDWQDFFVAAIWDAGGNDTIDASGYYEDQVISLLEESFSSLGGLTYNLSIARGVTIENAIGGEGNDRLVSNSVDNVLDGGNGLDVVDFSAATAGINFDVSFGSFTASGLGTDTLISIEGVVGTNFDDTLVGDDGDNFFEMLGGNDTITGALGTDWISLNGASTGVTIDASFLTSGTITVAGLGTNTHTGIEGIEGTSFADTFTGDSSTQLYRAGAGDDVVVASGGGDSYEGGTGHDTLDLTASTSGVELHLGTGTVYVTGSFGNFSQIEFENVLMTEFDDWVNATGDANTIETYGGNDQIYAQQGDDVVRAGAGNDWVSAWYGDDVVYGDDGDDTITGGFGNDRILGGNGNDTLEGEGDDDYVSGAGGNDIINGGDGTDHLVGGGGDDAIDGGSGNDLIEGGGASDTLNGESGDDVISGGAAADTIDGGIGNDELRGDEGEDNIIGGSGEDSIFGGNAADYLDGGVDDDYIEGGGNGDVIIGGEGNDVIFGMAGGDEINGGAGHDELSGGHNADLIYGGDGDDQILGGNSNDTLYGDDGDDTISGNLGSDTMYGGLGDDTLTGGGNSDIISGGAGHDRLTGGRGDDELTGGTGHDNINGGGEADTLFGGNGNDLLKGDTGSDVLNGGNGSDTLTGGTGADTLTGGDGVDIFVFKQGDSSLNNRDTITDLEAGELIDLSAHVFVADGAFTSSGQFEVRYVSGATSLLELDYNGDGTADEIIDVSGSYSFTSDGDQLTAVVMSPEEPDLFG